MKYFLILYFPLLFNSSFSQERRAPDFKQTIIVKTKTLSGDWSYSDKNSVFNLSLTQKEKIITGYHCSIMQNGNRIDCPNEIDSISIRGILVNPTTATVTFKSSYSDKNGKAKITRLSSTKIKWEIIKEPDQVYYIPKIRILSKE